MSKEITVIEQALWELLDDIDTAFDIFKPEMRDFERHVLARCQERCKYLHSKDGYSLEVTKPTGLTKE